MSFEPKNETTTALLTRARNALSRLQGVRKVTLKDGPKLQNTQDQLSHCVASHTEFSLRLKTNSDTPTDKTQLSEETRKILEYIVHKEIPATLTTVLAESGSLIDNQQPPSHKITLPLNTTQPSTPVVEGSQRSSDKSVKETEKRVSFHKRLRGVLDPAGKCLGLAMAAALYPFVILAAKVRDLVPPLSNSLKQTKSFQSLYVKVFVTVELGLAFVNTVRGEYLSALSNLTIAALLSAVRLAVIAKRLRSNVFNGPLTPESMDTSSNGITNFSPPPKKLENMVMARATYRCSPETNKLIPCHTVTTHVIIDQRGTKVALSEYLHQIKRSDLYDKLSSSSFFSSFSMKETPLEPGMIEYTIDFKGTQLGTHIGIPLPTGYEFHSTVLTEGAGTILPMIAQNHLGGATAIVLESGIFCYRVIPRKTIPFSQKTIEDLLAVLPPLALEATSERNIFLRELLALPRKARAETIINNETQKRWMYCRSKGTAASIRNIAKNPLQATYASGIGVCDSLAAAQAINFIESGIPALVGSGPCRLSQPTGSGDAPLQFSASLHAVTVAITENSYHALDLTTIATEESGESLRSRFARFQLFYRCRGYTSAEVGLSVRGVVSEFKIPVFSELRNFFLSHHQRSMITAQEPYLNSTNALRIATDKEILSSLLTEASLTPSHLTAILREFSARYFHSSETNYSTYRGDFSPQAADLLKDVARRIPHSLLPHHAYTFLETLGKAVKGDDELVKIVDHYCTTVVAGALRGFLDPRFTSPDFQLASYRAMEVAAVLYHCQLFTSAVKTEKLASLIFINIAEEIIKSHPDHNSSSPAQGLCYVFARSPYIAQLLGDTWNAFSRDNFMSSTGALRVDLLDKLEALEDPPRHLIRSLVGTILHENSIEYRAQHPKKSLHLIRECRYLPPSLARELLSDLHFAEYEKLMAHQKLNACMPWALANLVASIDPSPEFRIATANIIMTPHLPSELSAASVADRLRVRPTNPFQYLACQYLASVLHTQNIQTPRLATTINTLTSSDLFMRSELSTERMLELVTLWKEAQIQIENTSARNTHKLVIPVAYSTQEARSRKQRPHGNEYSHSRTYSIGDDMRDFDWHAYARNSEPTTKVFTSQDHRRPIIGVDIDWLSSTPSNPGRTGNFFHYDRVLDVFRTLHALRRRRNDCDIWLVAAGFAVEFDSFINGKGARRTNVKDPLLFLETIARGYSLINAPFGIEASALTAHGFNNVVVWHYADSAKKRTYASYTPAFNKIFGREEIVQQLRKPRKKL